MIKRLALVALLLFSYNVIAADRTIAQAAFVVQCNNGVIEKLFTDSCPASLGWSAGPLVPLNTAPVITLVGSSPVTYTEGDTYTELGATCLDTEDGSIAVGAPTFSPTLNMSNVGVYVATYTCTDTGSLVDTVQRTVNVNSAPITGALAFSNANLSGGEDIPQVFWAGMPDVNGDGCLDVYIGAHSDDTDSAMHIQDVSDGACLGTFTHFDNNNNYSQASPTTPRITSRYIFGNWFGHPEGFWSFMGSDVDGSASARYRLDPTFTTVGGNPSYLSKETGCFGARPKCLPIDVDGDGVFEIASRLFAEPFDTGYIVDIDTGATLYPSNGANDVGVGGLGVVDVNNDGVPEVIAPTISGYFEFDDVNNEMDFVASTFVGGTTDAYEKGNHLLAIDFDSDGDMDIYLGESIYNIAGTFIPYLYENDGAGNFVDVSATAFAGFTLNNTGFHSSYGNSQVGDVNLDGTPDIIYCAEEYDDTIVFLLNNGNGTFSKHPDVDMTPSGASFGLDSRRPWCQVADFDNDGKLDVVHNGPRAGTNLDGQLWRNTTSTNNNWIKIRVRGSGENTDGVHSRVTFYEQGTSNVISHWQIGAFSSGHQNMLAHTGIGTRTSVDVRVDYPHGGGTCDYSNVAADSEYISFPTCNIQAYTPGSAIPLVFSGGGSAVDTDITLIADSGITATATELVTFGLPFARGEVASLSEITVDIAGVEQAVYVEEGLTWWEDNSIRSATIQLPSVDMTSGNVVVNVTDEGSTVARLSKQTVTNGWADIVGATKDNHLSPRILPQHDTQYLADSGLIPPYIPDPVSPDSYALYRDDMFDDWQGTPLDYSSTTGANWLFDKASAHFKGYMASGDVTYLAEAARAKQFYFTHVRNDGTLPTAAGGDGCWTYGGTSCSDGKYIYPQPAKLALALLGDDSQWDDSLINEMAEQAQLGWSQWWFNWPYADENEGYTERSHGLIALAITNAYEITGSATVLADIEQAVTYTKDMQQTVYSFDTANGWGNLGCFRHAWSVHEGDTYPGDGTADDRRCSPWMSENVADFLWQTYWAVGSSEISNHGDLGEIMRRLGDSVERYAYETSTLEPTAPQVGIQAACGNACTTMSFCTAGSPPVVFYSMSDVASTAALRATAEGNGRSDTHIPEMVLIHAAARYFETDTTINAAHDARIARVDPDYYQIACADWYTGTGTDRLYQWQLRGNAQRTWDWVETQ